MGWNQKTNSKGGGGDGEGFEKPPVGNHPAVLVGLFDMGTQVQEFQGVEKSQHRAFFVWELVSAPMSGTKGRNHTIGIDLTVSLHEKAKLRQWIESRVGKKMPDDAEYDVSKELGQKCLLDVIANKKGYPVVNGMKSVPKGLSIPGPGITPLAMTLDDFKKGAKIPEWVPWLYGEHLADHIKRCEELAGKNSSSSSDDGVAQDDELAAAMEGREAGQADEDPIPF